MIVSNTEVTSFSTCKRAHFYRFGMKIEPKEHVISKALFRGIVGHRIWEVYYVAIKHGASVDEARRLAEVQIAVELDRVATTNPESYDMVQIILEVKGLLNLYTQVYQTDDFRVLEVETSYHTKISEDISYGLKLDLLIEMTKGEFRGDFVVLDHKFLYNFKTPRELDLDGQLPKYIKTVKDSGIVVTKGIFNQIRYRSLKNAKPEDLFKREWIKTKPTETARIWEDQLVVAEEIQEYKQLPLEEWDRKAVRNMSPYICRSCYFATVCKLQLNDQDITNALAMGYQANTYGYDSLLED